MCSRDRVLLFVVIASGFFVSVCIGQTDKVLSGRELLRAVRDKDAKDSSPPVGSGNTGSRTAPKHSAALELLDKYAETQNKVQSFIAKTDSLGETVSSNPVHKGRKIYTRTLSEIRCDGEQEYLLMYMWNDISSPREVKSKDEASYISNLWDGKSSFLSYARDQRNDLGSVIINRSSEYRIPDKILANSTDGTAMGICFGDDIRVDSILRKADSISVRDKTEHISGSECYVIDAETTNRGKYTLWIDPKHGYGLAKAEVRRREGDLSQGRPVPKGRLSIFLENVRFEKVDGIWIPMEWDIKVAAYWLNDHLVSKTHNKRMAITLNPDHDALGSFVPDDIKNGAKVYITGTSNTNYTWKDGKVVDAQGREFDLNALKPAEPVSLVGKRLPSLEQLGAKLDPAEVEGKRLLVCFFDMNQRPSRNCVLRIKRKARALSQKGVYVILVHAQPVDKDKLNAWLREHSVALPVCQVTGDVKQEWNVQSLPWVVLTDEEHVVQAEGFGIEELDERIKR